MPECVRRTFEKVARDPEVYAVMNGPSEFHVTGVIRDWDIVARLGEIRIPTLVVSGRHDEATPAIAETFRIAESPRRCIFDEDMRGIPLTS
jgi:L-proline amide hydrolase